MLFASGSPVPEGEASASRARRTAYGFQAPGAAPQPRPASDFLSFEDVEMKKKSEHRVAWRYPGVSKCKRCAQACPAKPCAMCSARLW